jgi:peptidoglycan/LPS O-acetylase OafA/YrhL
VVGLGGFSYSLYLIHHPIEQVIYAYRPDFVQGPVQVFWYLMAAGLPMILIFSWVFALVFERPFVTRRAPKEAVLETGLVPLSLPLKTFEPYIESPAAPRMPERRVARVRA